MGGSIATKATSKVLKDYYTEEFHKQIQGLFVIDVVEGSAMDALPFMENIVLSRPQEFKTKASVVQYGIKSGTVKDIESARLSMPDQVVPKIDPTTGNFTFVWRTDLMATKEYWEGWFKGLTQCFLDVRVPKQLLLAGSDRMDKDLTIAQMQGKFKLVVLDNVGHAIHEDQPRKVAEVFHDFLNQFRIPTKYAEQMVVTSVSGKKVVISH
jgi:protein phosphatase methylesterase 1